MSYVVQHSCTYCTYWIKSFIVNIGVVYSATAQPHTSEHDNSGLLRRNPSSGCRTVIFPQPWRSEDSGHHSPQKGWLGRPTLSPQSPKDPEEVTDLRNTEGWGVTTELTLTPPLTLTDTGALHLTLTDTGKPEYIDCYATLITESITSVPPMIIGFLVCTRVYT